MGDIVLFSPFVFVSVPRVSLRLPWAMNRLAFQAASGEGFRTGTQGVAPLALGYEQISLSGCIGRGAKEEDKSQNRKK